MKKQLVDPQGRPIHSAPLDGLAALGVRDMGDYVQIDKRDLERVVRERNRSLSDSRAPVLPWGTNPDIGNTVPRGAGRWSAFSFDFLRDVREKSPLLGPIHQHRQYTTRAMAQLWSGEQTDVGIRIVHHAHRKQGDIQPDAVIPYIRNIEALFNNPAPTYKVRSLRDMLSLLMDDLLTINRPALELIPSLLDPSVVVQLRPVDGGLLWDAMPAIEQYKAQNPSWAGRPTKNLSIYQELELLSTKLDIDFFGAEHVIVEQGMPLSAHRPGRFIVAPYQNRTSIAFARYPPSHVEMALQHAFAFLNAFNFNASLFTRGMLTEFIIGVSGDVHPDDLQHFADMLREVTQGVRNAHQPPIMPLPANGTLEKIPLRDNPKDMSFETLMSLTMSLGAAIYREDMSALNAKPWSGGQGSPLSEGSRFQEILWSRQEGLKGDVGHLLESQLTPVVRRFHPDLVVIAEWGDHDEDREAKIFDTRANTEMTRNEVRIQRGQEPEGVYLTARERKSADEETLKKHDENIWNWPKDQGFASAKAQQANAAMYDQQQQAPPGQEAPPGADDDGFGETAPNPGPFGSPEEPEPQPAQKPAKPDTAPSAPDLAKATTYTIHLHDH